MKDARYYTILSEPSAFWVANVSENNVPDVVRCAGLAPVTDLHELTIYISEKFGRKFFKNLRSGSWISFSATSVPTFESFQYKGIFQSIRPCTREEEEKQRRYYEDFTALTADFGFVKDLLFRCYFHVPAFAVTFRVQEIFDQTPRKGTGQKVVKLESNQ